MKQISVIIKLLTISIIILVAASCSVEKNVATEFVINANKKNILVIAPVQLYKTNLKTYLMDSLGIDKDDENKDELLLRHSKFLYDLNDSLFIANYMLGYKKSLIKFGFNVFTENEIDSFLALDSNSYQVNIAQIELEETIYTFRDEETIYDSHFFHDHNLNAVYVNSWFEVNNLNEENAKHNIYFTSDMITDIVDGMFDYDVFSNQVRYMYNIDSLQQKVLYAFAYRLGGEYANYTFDLLLNNTLDKKVDPSIRKSKYWRYDPYNHTFYLASDDKFIILED